MGLDFLARRGARVVNGSAFSGSLIKFSGCSKLATEMSSSTASQWIPTPPPISSQPALCFAYAPASRGNQAKGTATVRPSERTTRSSSSVHATSMAIASAFSTKVLMPLLQKELLILEDHWADFGQFVTPKAAIVREHYRLKPKLRITPGVSYMDMRRLSSFKTVKEESVTAKPQKRRHQASLPCNLSTWTKWRMAHTFRIMECMRWQASGGIDAVGRPCGPGLADTITAAPRGK